jgi:hypothetical protein
MPFVQRARSNKEQNLVAYQQNQQIYFATCKPIEAGTELLLWYAHDYAGLLGEFMDRIFCCPIVVCDFK